MKRRLRVLDANGEVIKTSVDGKPIPHFEVDLSDRPNANAQCPFSVVIEEECNLGHFHGAYYLPLPCWDDNDWKKDKRA